MSAVHKLITDHLDIWTAADTEKKSGRGRASGNANSVYGIKKLRELILELAVQGRLISPHGDWQDLKLGALGKWAIGSGFPIAEQGVLGEDIFFVKVSDMNLAGNEKFITIANNTVSLESAKRLRLNIHESGTVIFPKIGGAIATNKRRIITRKTAIDNNCLGLTPRDGVTTEWLFLVLSNIDFSKYQAGTSVPALAQSVLHEIPVRCPDTKEQLLIVAKVDELMALCDQLEAQHNNAADAHEQLVCHLLSTLTQSQDAADFNANWQRIATHFDTLFTTESSIDTLKQTLLQLAVMGKLVPQDPNDEPASELLQRIQAEKAKLVAEGKIKKNKPLAEIDDDEKPFELPHGWSWTRVSQLFAVTSGGSFDQSAELESGEIAYVKVGDMNLPGNEIEITTSTRFVNPSEREMRGIIPVNSIIFPKRGGAIATNKKRFITSNVFVDLNIMAITVPHTISVQYTFHWLEGIDLARLNTGTSVPQINHQDIEPLVFPLAPLQEQHRIVTKVEQLKIVCEQLKAQITNAKQCQQKLVDSLLVGAIN